MAFEETTAEIRRRYDAMSLEELICMGLATLGLLIATPLLLCFLMLAWSGVFSVAQKGWGIFSYCLKENPDCFLTPHAIEALPKVIDALPHGSNGAAIMEVIQGFLNCTT